MGDRDSSASSFKGARPYKYVTGAAKCTVKPTDLNLPLMKAETAALLAKELIGSLKCQMPAGEWLVKWLSNVTPRLEALPQDLVPEQQADGIAHLLVEGAHLRSLQRTVTATLSHGSVTSQGCASQSHSVADDYSAVRETTVSFCATALGASTRLMMGSCFVNGKGDRRTTRPSMPGSTPSTPGRSTSAEPLECLPESPQSVLSSSSRSVPSSPNRHAVSSNV
eukprot:6296841-Prymnesium_polylepis.1